MELVFEEKDFLSCCGSTRFAKDMALASPFSSLQHALSVARDIWFNKVDVSGWLQAFSAHPPIGQTRSPSHASQTSAQWSKGEQSTALATATGSSLQVLVERFIQTGSKYHMVSFFHPSLAGPASWFTIDFIITVEKPFVHEQNWAWDGELSEWNARYMQKFGFVFLICASGRSTDEILAELKRRYTNRPIVEFEIAAQEQMKITELRLTKLFSSRENISSENDKFSTVAAKKAEEDRISIIGGHVTAASGSVTGKSMQKPARTRPPITTHVLDVSRGCPAAGIEVLLEMWRGNQARPTFGAADGDGWVIQGSSTTDPDGRSGQLLSIVDDVSPGIYRISFNSGKYNPNGFFPYVSIVFEILESQTRQHFHVPLLLSPFSFSTYRGS